MSEEYFESRKAQLTALIESHLRMNGLSKEDDRMLNLLQQSLDKYSFTNRISKKGLLSHTIVDSINLDAPYNDLLERCIWFDNEIK